MITDVDTFLSVPAFDPSPGDARRAADLPRSYAVHKSAGTWEAWTTSDATDAPYLDEDWVPFGGGEYRRELRLYMARDGHGLLALCAEVRTHCVTPGVPGVECCRPVDSDPEKAYRMRLYRGDPPARMTERTVSAWFDRAMGIAAPLLPRVCAWARQRPARWVPPIA